MSESENFQDNEAGVSPGALFNAFLQMEELLDKLKLLNYEKDFLKSLKMKPLSKYYFALQTNPGEQFFLFVSLTAWLSRLCGKKFEQPQEYDDPNSTIATLLDVAREMGAHVDFPPNRLKPGFGENVVYLLNFLAEQAVRAKSIQWERMELIEESHETVAEVEDDSELILEKVEEEMAKISDDDEGDDEEDLLHIDNLRNLYSLSLHQHVSKEEILESTVGLEEWQLELERVLPQLKVSVSTDARDWRSHLEQIKKHRGSLKGELETAKNLLEKIREDIVTTLEKIGTREKHLNQQLDELLKSYQGKQEELKKVMNHYQSVNGKVVDRTKIITKLTEELESIRRQIDEKSTSMTDGTPLVHIKKSISNITEELKEMDVRLGVLDSEILQTRLRQNSRVYADSVALQVF